MTHLAPDELIDAVDGALAPDRRQHLDTCERCRLEAAGLRALMADVRDVDVPEPPPFFWDRLSTGVRQQLAEGASPRPARWFEWPVFVPLAAMALLIVALVGMVADYAHGPGPIAVLDPVAIVAKVDESMRAEEVVADVDVESQWALLAELVGDLDYDAATAEGIVPPVGAADAAVLHLSVVEQAELARLLRAELKPGG